ncbi:Hypothetical protein AA314_03840 [Archangium gephyra]|uniref:Uncharacterized protein n=1 Tax=Archangium gephyra TaxID=48 RepID=A0AAC8Q7K5_9BACT|nr:Hypothetical protein AA314_03840 [Archangium gephyra]
MGGGLRRRRGECDEAEGQSETREKGAQHVPSWGEEDCPEPQRYRTCLL